MTQKRSGPFDHVIVRIEKDNFLHILSHGTAELLPEDLEGGYVDYIYDEADDIASRTPDGGDGGCWLLKKEFHDLFQTPEQVADHYVRRILCIPDQEYEILDDERYQELMGLSFKERWA